MTAETKRRIFNDTLLILAIALIAVLTCVIVYCSLGEGGRAVVELDGKELGSYPLSEDTEVRIGSELGENILVIKDGKAYVSSADCPDGICVSHYPISREGETIVCLPHRLVIRIAE